MGIPAASGGIGGWTVGPVIGRRPAGVARDVVHPGTGARAVMVIVDGRFTGRGLPDPESVARAAIVGSPAVMPMLDAGLLEDGTRWYVTPAAPGPVLDPAAGCSPRRAATIVEAVARALAAVHAAGLVHGLVGPESVVPAAGRHAERPVGTTLLLDTGVAALLGERADDLAAISSVSMPSDRGPAADVHALGGLLLRLLTAAAPAGPALAALPVELRGLLSAMLDEHPSRRPTADAVARSLAGMREGLLATAPVGIQAAAPAPAPVRAPAPVSAPTAAVPRPVTRPAVVLTPRPDVPPPVVPAPIPAPHTIESPIIVPRSSPAPAPSLWTGPVRIAPPARPARRRTKRVLLLAGGVGLAGLLVGVVTHLPISGHQDGEQAVAAAAQNGVLAVPATPGPVGTAASGSAAPSTRSRKASSAPALSLVSEVAPAFVTPTKAVPSPLAASASSTTPSRNTTQPTRRSGTTTTAPTSSAPSSPSAGSSSTSSSSTSPSSSSPTSSDTSSSTPGATSSSAPTTDPSSSGTSTPSESAPEPSDSSAPDTSAPDTSTPDPASTDGSSSP